jgi:hypothetical protein
LKVSWRKYAAATLKIEDKYVNSIREAIASHLRSFTDNLTQYGQDYAVSQLTLTPWNNDLIPILQALYKDAGLQGAKRQYRELKDSIKEGRKFNLLGTNEAWIEAVLDYLRIHLLNKAVAPITQTTKEHILKVLDIALKEGWSYSDIVKTLQDEGYLGARARLVVRTEVNRASNVGHKIGAQTFPYEVTKKWSAARDHRTRHSHRDVHNKEVEENGKFIVDVYKGKVKIGTEEMEHPGDPNASAGNVVNCRCRQLYEPKRDVNGNLILRPTNTPRIVDTRTPTLTQLFSKALK